MSSANYLVSFYLEPHKKTSYMVRLNDSDIFDDSVKKEKSDEVRITERICDLFPRAHIHGITISVISVNSVGFSDITFNKVLYKGDS